jgi:transposase InsO family protein
LKKVVTPAAGPKAARSAYREAAAHLQACHGMSERRACRVIDTDRKSVRYRSTRDDDGALSEKLRELANQRRRFGYRRFHMLLRREGVMINRKKTQRLYREEGLAVRRRRSRRRAVGTRAVNRLSIGTPYRRAKGTPLPWCGLVGAGRVFRAAGGVGRA